MSFLKNMILITALLIISSVGIMLKIYDVGLTSLGLNLTGFERSMCDSYNPIKAPSHLTVQCPQKLIVTVQKLGRLGNQMWEYISVWAVAKKTGREPYVPSCILQELEKVFQNLTVPPLSHIAHCIVEKYSETVAQDKMEHMDGSILLPAYAQLPKYVIPILSEVLQIFRFKKHLVETSEILLREASRGVDDVVYVGVHVRRTDYEPYLRWKYNISMVEPDFFLRQMQYFRKKYEAVVFVVVSDDPVWCDSQLTGDDVVVMRNNNSPAQDLAIMAACNHSILDYGTFGLWGAIFAGGETLLYNLTRGTEFEVSQLIPNWRLVS